MDYSLNFLSVITFMLYVSIVLIESIGFTYLFIIKSIWNIAIKITFGSIFYPCLILTVIYHFEAMVKDNSIEKGITNDILSTRCDKCNEYRPKRAHHCRECGVCIKKMDHHCPWIFNCVGEENYKSFTLFLIFAEVGSFICALCTLQCFICYIQNNNIPINYSIIAGLSFWNRFFIKLEYTLPVLTFSISVVICLAVGFILYFQFNNLKYNMTMIEMKLFEINLEDCPNYNKNFKDNFKREFGDGIIDWLKPWKIENKEDIENNYKRLI